MDFFIANPIKEFKKISLPTVTDIHAAKRVPKVVGKVNKELVYYSILYLGERSTNVKDPVLDQNKSEFMISVCSVGLSFVSYTWSCSYW